MTQDSAQFVASSKDRKLNTRTISVKTKYFSVLVVIAALVCSACGKSDKDYTPPPPSENVDSPPPGGTQEKRGQPRP
jgi:hypothetical protein